MAIASRAGATRSFRCSRLRRLAGRALPLVAGLWICGPVPAALAQEARTLVSNTGQATAAGSTPVLAIQSLATRFSTGASNGPWTLTAVRLDVAAWESGATPTVSLRADSDGSPGATIATLANPAAGTGLKAFAVPSGSTVTLQANTTYAVVIESDTTFANYLGFSLRNTESAAEDDGGAVGWRIGDDRLVGSGSGWSVSNGNLKTRMAVLGTGGTVSDDATLTTLTLADSGGIAISLDATFAAGTTSYSASVAWSVSTVTATATATHTGATVSFANDDDTTTPGTAELSLGVGANTVAVTVTAQDGATTRTYTVTVTRAALAATDPRTLVGNTGQPTATRGAPVLSVQSLAMQFTTGNSARRWTLKSIRLEVIAWQSGVVPAVSLHAAAGPDPGARITTLTNPSPGTDSNAFTAPPNTKLTADTTYAIVVSAPTLALNGFTIAHTDSTAEDGGGAPGWQIADTGRTNAGQGWSAGSHTLKLAVVGVPDSGDAALDTLTLADGDNDIALDPGFAADTTTYAATVTHAVSTVTVSADAAHAGATVSIADDDDTATPGTADLDLDVGANAIAITVTAQDGTTAKTYTVSVVRASAAPAPVPSPAPRTLVGNTARPQQDSVEVHKARRRVGIKFTTGESATPWTLNSVRLNVTAWHPGATPTVRLRLVPGRWPGTTVATLTNPSPGTGSMEFTAPPGLKLQPNTTYGIVVAAGVRQGRFNLGITQSNHEDAGGAAGWSIADTSRSYASAGWSSFPQSLMIAVQGTGVATGSTASGLTGWFASPPAEHDGSAAFRVRIGFSDAVRISRNAMREHAVQVTDGRVTRAKRARKRSDLWDITITPSGLDAVRVTVTGGRACSTAGAVCTRDGRALAETLALTVPGPVALSVADARADEGTDAAAAFTVTLSRASTRTVTVDYATADGTAQAGQDYTATSGTLTFAAGVVERTVSVPVLDDARNEGEESFTLTLSNATGALLDDAEATGTIVNGDPIPKAWIARFGRTVASQAAGAIGHRLAYDGGSRVVIAGVALGGAAESVPERESARDALRYDHVRDVDRRPHDAHAASVSPRALLLASEFRLRSGNGANAPAWTTWGRFASSGFDATQDEVDLDGDVTTGIVGVDASRDRWLAGLAVSLSEGDGSFANVATGGAADRGRVESRLTGVYPYARHRLTERVDVWGLVGYGAGELKITEHAGGSRTREVVTETDLSMRMGAVGTRGKVLSAAESGGPELAVKGDVFWVRMESEAVDSQGPGPMEASTGEASRLRLVVQGWQAFELVPGTTFTPSAQLGVRHDGGDAETGTGIEAGAGVSIGGRRFAMEAAVRGLVAHEEGSFEGWGLGGSIRIEPGVAGRGLSLRLEPAWGAGSGGVERLWSLSSARDLAPDRDFGAGRRLDSEVAYGLGLGRPREVLTPYAGLALASGGTRAWRTGARWTRGPDTALRIELVREHAGDGDAPESALVLRAHVRW